MGRRIRLLIGVLMLGLWSGSAGAIEIAGRVERLLGEAHATGSTGLKRPLQVGSTILVGDRLATAQHSRLRLRSSDGALLTLGGLSTLAVRSEAVSGPLDLELVEGQVQATSGFSTGADGERLAIEAAWGRIAVRGGTVWMQQGPEQLRVLLQETGADGVGAALTTAFGTAELNMPGYGVSVAPGETPAPAAPWDEQLQAEARESVAFD